MKRSLVPIVLCLLLALLVSAPVSTGADKPPKELWDEFPLDATPEPTPSAEAPAPTATPAPSAQPQAPAAGEDDGGGGLATPALLALLVGAAGLGGAAVFMASRRMTTVDGEPAAEPVARSGRFARRDEEGAVPAARVNGHPLEAAVAAERQPKPHPVSRAKAARRARHARRDAPPAPHDAEATVPPPAKPRRSPDDAPATTRRSPDDAPAKPRRSPDDAPAEPRRRAAAPPEDEPAPEPAPAADAADPREARRAARTRARRATEPPAEPPAESPPEPDVAPEPQPAQRRRGGWKRRADDAAPRRDEVAAERITRPRPRPRPVPAEPVAEADDSVYPACRVKLHNRPIRTHFYAVPFEGGPVLARSPYFKLERGAGESGPTAAEALRALVEQLHALGWQQTGVGSAPWDLRFQRGVRVPQRRG